MAGLGPRYTPIDPNGNMWPWYLSRAEQIANGSISPGSGPYSHLDGDHASFMRMAGLTGTFADLVAESQTQGKPLPGLSGGSTGFPGLFGGAWLIDMSEENALVVRAWCEQYAPTFIDPTAVQPSWAIGRGW